MKVKWLHHIVDVWLLWSLWAYCIKGGKTRMTKSQFVQVLNWLVRKVALAFWTNHTAKLRKTKATIDYFRHSIEKCSVTCTMQLWRRCIQIYTITYFLNQDPVAELLSNNRKTSRLFERRNLVLMECCFERPNLALAIFLMLFQLFLTHIVFRDSTYPNNTATIDNRNYYI